MKVFSSEQIRNIGLGGHSGAGKTSLIEAMLFGMGETNRIGTVEQGNTISDYNADEVERQVSISASLTHGVWKDTKVNLVDTPGFSDFYGDTVSGLRAADILMIVVSAANGIEVGTERVRELADKYELPRFYVINKMERENVEFMAIYNELRERFGKKLSIAQIPIESGPGFNSVVDIIKQKVYKYSNDQSGKVSVEDIPGNIKDKVDKIREELVETVAESDDALLEQYFEAGELTEEEFISGFRNAVNNQMLVPVVCASATQNLGIASLLDFIVDYLPAPSARPAVENDGASRNIADSDPLSALIFKTISEAHVGELSFVKVVSGVLKAGDEAYNPNSTKSERIGQIYVLNGKNKKNVDQLHAGDIGALVKLKSTHTGDTLCTKSNQFIVPPIEFPEPLISVAVVGKGKGDEDKIGAGLNALHQEDPTFLVRYDGELRQTIASGQGELHLDIIFKRLKQKFGVEVDTEKPRIPYRETILKKAEAQGKFKKQSGGRGQYGDAHLRLEPQPRGEGFEFADEITGGVIPGKFIPAVEKGAIETCEKGVLAGYPVVDVKVAVYYGSYHNVDSSEMAFKVASSMAFKKAFMEAKPILLEPIYKLQVKVPDTFMGDVMGDISGRRGKVSGMDADGRFQVINATVPLAELYKYSNVLRSMTGGQGLFHIEFSHYEQVPGDEAKKIIEASKKSDDE